MADDDFYAVLTAAIDDLVTYGFDSIERVERWSEALRAAAERSMISPVTMEQMLRELMAAIYRRMVEQGGIVKYNPGIDRFTLERVKPSLRAELDRRIMASANLIRLNRKQAIDKTLQRFQGWSTSIPKGGTDVASRRETKDAVRKSLASLPFEERRVLIDQGHKLTASLNDILATDGGAIAGRWQHHHVTYPRPEHVARDGDVFLIRDSWAHRAGLVKPLRGRGYTDDIEKPGELPLCRCTYVYKYHLRELPPEMLTKKGREALSAARQAMAGMTRSDSVDDGVGSLLSEARRRDPLGYLRGVKAVRMVADRDRWHASYQPDRDEIALEDKFARLPPSEQLHIVLHEAGHRGQDVDAEAYEAFKRMHLNRLPFFLDMANQAHLLDFQKSGKVDSIAAEVFAESYARHALGLDMPAELKRFWKARTKVAA